MGNLEKKQLNIKQYFIDEDIYEKYRLNIAELIFREGGFARDYFHLILKKMFHKREQNVNIEGLTDEVYEFYLRKCERDRSMGAIDLAKPAKDGFKHLYDGHYKDNFGNKN